MMKLKIREEGMYSALKKTFLKRKLQVLIKWINIYKLYQSIDFVEN